MGLTKTDHYTETQIQIAGMLKALGHPGRLAIVEYLLQVNACVCGDIVNALPLAQPTISQHLKELKNAGLIQGTIEGKSVCYCLNPESLQLLNSYFLHMKNQINPIDSCC
jgi:DNA-binding transcriptional ArsR family regulator